MIDLCTSSARRLAAGFALIAGLALGSTATAQNCLTCNGTPEGEACVNNSVGNNGGCNATPPVFVNATIGTTYCGTTWANAGAAPNRDTDWYRVTPNVAGLLSGTLVSETSNVVFIVGGIANCAPAVLGQIGHSNQCLPGTPGNVASANVAAGVQVVVFVAPGNADGSGIFAGQPCGSLNDDYSLAIALTPAGAEACCLIDGSCLANQLPLDCEAMGGTPQGPGSVCGTVMCPAICGPTAGDCCAANGTPGCNNPDCCSTVCEIDPFCCDDNWDGLCAAEAAALCEVCGGGGNCSVACTDNEAEPCGTDVNGGCNSSPNPLFDDRECGEIICGNTWADGGTRDTDWYRVLVDAGPLTGTAVSEVPVVIFIVDGIATCAPAVIGTTGDSANCQSNVAASANVAAGQYVVFVAPGVPGSGLFEGFPCGGNNEYQLTIECTPAGPCTGATGSCFGSHASPGCDFSPCCEAVCNMDPTCCNVTWDNDCVAAAFNLCDVEFICANSTGNCCVGDAGTLGCESPDCCAAVCDFEPQCCFIIWDAFCADLALNGPDTVPGSGDEFCMPVGPGLPPCALPACPLSCAGTAEGEACGDDSNGGCNGTPVAFGSIDCGETVCGTAWAAGATRDTDWYQFTLSESTDVSLNINGQLPVVAFFVDGIDDCMAVVVGDIGSADGCTAGVAATATLTAGTYAAFAAVGNPDGSGIFEGFPCGTGPNFDGNQYSMQLVCGTPPPSCTLSCTGINEAEICGADSNGGCNGTPVAFETIEPGDTICGTAWAEGGTRDTDWYGFTVTGSAADLTADLNSEFPGVAFFVGGIDGCVPVVLGDAGDAADCTRNAQAAATLDPGNYALFVAVDSFDFPPCGVGPGGSGNFYSVTLGGGTPCPADTNNDGVVDVQDLTAVILAWGMNNPAADVNNDGIVDVQDLTAVILAWGNCP